MSSKYRALFGALAFAVIRSVWPGDAAANTYDVVVVSIDR